MHTYNCIHYSICINSLSLLCFDSRCRLVKQQLKIEDIARVERVEQAIKKYKKEHNIESFLDRKI